MLDIVPTNLCGKKMAIHIQALDISGVKNLVRGGYSKLKQVPGPQKSRKKNTKILQQWSLDLSAQFQINEALVASKKHLTTAEIFLFEEWILDLLRDVKVNQNQLGNRAINIGLIPYDATGTNLNIELKLSLGRLKHLEQEFRGFVQDYCRVVEKILDNNWEESRAHINLINTLYGYSYWGIENLLATTQKIEGVDSVKSLIRKITIGSSALNKFYVHHFGVRNEPAQTTLRFQINLNKRLNESDLNSTIQNYSKFRLYGKLEHDEKFLSNILSCEQLNTGIDLFFTLIKVTKLIINNPGKFSPSVMEEAEAVVNFFKNLHNTLDIFNLCGKPHQSFDQLTRFATHSLSVTLQLSNPNEFKSFLEKLISNGLVSKLSTRSDGIDAEELEKFFLNFNNLPLTMLFGEISNIQQLPQYLLNVENPSMDESNINSINDAIKTNIHKLSTSTALPSDELELLIRATNSTDLQELMTISSKIRTLPFYTKHLVLKDTINIILAHTLFKNNYVVECINICAELSIENDTLIPLLPLAEIFQGVRWQSLSSLGPSLDLSIALNSYLKVSGDRKIRTFKRYSVKQLLDHLNVSNVLDLLKRLQESEHNSKKLEFFAYEVCDTITLELLPGGENSRKIMLLRKDILGFLASMKTSQHLKYLYEESLIKDRLEVDDGMNVLDDSKVFVDEPPILNIINKDMAADFQRYLKLVSEVDGTPESVSDVLKNINTLSSSIFQIPKNDADDLLAQILSSMLENFLFDSASGLDIIIGRRIRHGTLQGEIRGYLEQVGLMGLKPHAGANYTVSPRVQQLSLQLDPKKRKVVTAAFSRFYESIDQLITLLRDEYFHVRSKNKPRGIFELNVNPVMFSLARGIAHTCPSIESFSKQCFELFWFFLTASVDLTRPSKEAEIKKSLTLIFTKLFNQLRYLNISDPEFYSHLQQANDELQRKAISISSWIRVPESTIEGGTYSIQRIIDIATAKVISQRLGFKPLIKASPLDLVLDVHGFHIVFDALYIALDNICQHSGKKIDNQIDIQISLSRDKSLLHFTITNQVALNSDRAENESKLQTLRNTIQKKAYVERARSDRGSGLAKLAALVMQSDKTNISFGYEGLDEFKLKFDLIFLSGVNKKIEPSTRSASFLSSALEVAE